MGARLRHRARGRPIGRRSGRPRSQGALAPPPPPPSAPRQVILLFSLLFYLVGLLCLTLSASVPGLKPVAGQGATASSQGVFWAG